MHPDQIFDIFPKPQGALVGLNDLLKSITGLQEIQGIYRQLNGKHYRSGEFIGEALKLLAISWKVRESELVNLPAQGPLVIVSNHPFGGVEAMVLARVLLQARPDVKIIANHLLHRLPELKELILPVDPFDQPGSKRANLAALKQAISWVKNGGALVLFPAGAVAHFQLDSLGVTDPEWKPAVGRLIQRCQAPVSPVFFPGANDAVFQCAGVLHPGLRTVLLGRELVNKQGRCLEMRIGRPIPAERLGALEPSRAISYLRQRTYLLAAPPTVKPGHPVQSVAKPLASAVDPDILEREIAGLPLSQCLVQSGKLAAWIAESPQIPCLLQEIGRRREETFRASGEGSGKALDLDVFDREYLQLFLWDRENRCLAGGYRLGPTDRVRSLYTRGLFSLPADFLTRMSPALELGRSFVCRGYQRTYLPLMLLWKGIGRYLVLNPRYRFLFGAVSMSADYSQYSRVLLANYLEKHHAHPAVRSSFRNPLAQAAQQTNCLTLPIATLNELSEIITEMEPDRKAVPVLIEKYLELGGKILAFAIDRKFGNTLDGLIVVDLAKSNRRLLEFYLGKAGAAQYLAQGENDPESFGRSRPSPGIPVLQSIRR